ncbi:MAG: ABATE domain-containing protein [Steroidobacteraceae bacterium]
MTAWVRATSDDLCLYFANTRYWRGRAEPTETLNRAEDLLLWVAANGGYDAETAARMKEKSPPRGADKWLQQAVELREAMFRVFAHMAASSPPAPEDLNELNRELRAAPPRNLVADSIGGAAWQIRTPTLQLADLLAPVLWSTADLLVGNAAQRVRQCANPECQWLFIDRSKGGTRRWCDMGACGNRAKASRHYQRKKEALATSVAKK